MEADLNKKYSFQLTLGTITQTEHWKIDGAIEAYEPYVREMRVWADLFSSIDIFTPLTHQPIQVTLSRYERKNLRFRFVTYETRISFLAQVKRLIQLPIVILQMIFFIARHDVLLIRSPGHFALVAHVLVFLMRKKSITKFAGFFGPFQGERIPSVVERYFIFNFLKPPHFVLVYGRAAKSHLISFFPLVLSRSEIQALRNNKRQRTDDGVALHFYSLGRLTKVKGFDLAVQGFGLLHKNYPDLQWEYHLIGEGPEYDNLKQIAQSSGISDRIFFEGKLSYLKAMEKLRNADVVVMPGTMEGWPKVVAEAWAMGSVPFCVEAGLLPEIIKDGYNGFLFKPSPEAFAERAGFIINHGDSLKDISNQAKMELEELSSERFKERLEEVCKTKLGL